MSFGAIVLTQGNRRDDLNRAVESLLRQRDVEADVVVVGNGWHPANLPEGARGIELKTNIGIPAGRNAGVKHVCGDLLFFLDDDASLESDRALATLQKLFDEDPDIGLAQLRVEPREGHGRGPKDWNPRIGRRKRTTPGDITVVWEGAVAMRRDVFELIGGWPEPFRFVHEGVDLAWRVLDAGYRVHYAADLVALHPLPVPSASRHGYSRYYGARNKVLLARRHLPLPLAVLYVGTFALRTLPLLLRSPRDIRRALRGYRAGMREPCGERKTLRPRTLWRMTRAGRPPLI
jgi:GT2 family glycosyltransferase